MNDEQRVEMTISCRDTDCIPKALNAGQVEIINGQRVQIMHNGTKVLADGYCGEWMTRIIHDLQGHHEPQEELLFHALLKYVRLGSMIVELGAYWAYYSAWYLREIAESSAICVEPNRSNMAIGRANMALNGLEKRAAFKQAWVGWKQHGTQVPDDAGRNLECLDMDAVCALAGRVIEVLHIDAQGAELGFIQSMGPAVKRKAVRFMMVSTHHTSISGSNTTHYDCLHAIQSLGGQILVEHDIDESFSGDGLIVASFDPADKRLSFPQISRNLPGNSLFPPSPFISYAQNFEDVILWRALKHVKNGCYVDVGANDPVIDSVSKAFYDRGWRGIHIEPVLEFAELLRKDRPDEMVLQVALGESEGMIAFNVVGGLSTAVAEYAQDYIKRGIPIQTVHVPVLTLKSALTSLVGREVHWLKIDVEGFEKQVIQGWDSQVLRPWVMVIEATTPGSPKTAFSEWDPILVAANYQFVYFDGLNRFYVAKEHPELFCAFECPPNVFDRARLSGLACSDWCQEVSTRQQQAEVGFRFRESALQSQVQASATREAQLIRQLRMTKHILHVLNDRVDKQPFRLRRLICHPKVTLPDVRGAEENVVGYPLLAQGFVDDQYETYFSLPWILRQPRKTLNLILRQPKKTLGFALRHPKHFVAGGGAKRGRPNFSDSHYPFLSDGFVDRERQTYFSLRWMFRHPRLALGLVFKQPRKTVGFVLKQPGKFLRGTKLHVQKRWFVPHPNESIDNVIKSLPVALIRMEDDLQHTIIRFGHKKTMKMKSKVFEMRSMARVLERRNELDPDSLREICNQIPSALRDIQIAKRALMKDLT